MQLQHGWGAAELAHPPADVDRLPQGHNLAFLQEPIELQAYPQGSRNGFSSWDDPASEQNTRSWSITPSWASPRAHQDADELSAIHAKLGMPPQPHPQQPSYGFPDGPVHASFAGTAPALMASRPDFDIPWIQDGSEEVLTQAEHDMQRSAARKRQRGPHGRGADYTALKDEEETPVGEDPDWEPGQDDSPRSLPRPARGYEHSKTFTNAHCHSFI